MKKPVYVYTVTIADIGYHLDTVQATSERGARMAFYRRRGKHWTPDQLSIERRAPVQRFDGRRFVPCYR